jgi:hypothetical protein
MYRIYAPWASNPQEHAHAIRNEMLRLFQARGIMLAIALERSSFVSSLFLAVICAIVLVIADFAKYLSDTFELAWHVGVSMGGFQNTLPTCIKLALPRQNINPHPISYTN